MARAFLGLGSNLGDRVGHLRRAVAALPDLVAVSPVYETDPVGGPDEQGPYLNLVAELDTASTPARAARAVPHASRPTAERVREERWGPRTLDVDVLGSTGTPWHERRPRGAPPADVGAALRAGAARRPGARPGHARPAGRRRGRGATARRPRRPRPPTRRSSDDARPHHRARPGRARRSPPRSRGPGGRCCPTLGRDDDLGRGRRRHRPAADRHPRPRHLRGGPRGEAGRAHGGRPPVRLGRAAPAGVAPPPGRAPPARRPARRRARAPSASSAPGSGWPRTAIRSWPRSWPACAAGSCTWPRPGWARYHAAAVIASNHLVALLGQAERVAASVGAPVEAFLDLARGQPRRRRRPRAPRRAHRAGPPRRHRDRRAPPRRPPARGAPGLRGDGRGGQEAVLTTVDTIADAARAPRRRARRRADRRASCRRWATSTPGTRR